MRTTTSCSYCSPILSSKVHARIDARTIEDNGLHVISVKTLLGSRDGVDVAELLARRILNGTESRDELVLGIGLKDRTDLPQVKALMQFIMDNRIWKVFRYPLSQFILCSFRW